LHRGGGGLGWRTKADPCSTQQRNTIELAGSEDGASVAVTVLKVVDPAPYEAYFGPQKGNRYVGIKLRLHNTGSTVYDDCPSERFGANRCAGPRVD
jgi:hypothetical protein